MFGWGSRYEYFAGQDRLITAIAVDGGLSSSHPITLRR
jgi:hypothetical protein